MSSNIEGYLFDIYNIEDQIVLWVKYADTIKYFMDSYFPTIYIKGNPVYEAKFINRLRELNALQEEPKTIKKKAFYSGEWIPVKKIQITKPTVLKKIYQKLYAFYEKLEIFHSDIDITTSYLAEKNIYPFGIVNVEYDGDKVLNIQSISNLKDYDYQYPKLTYLEIALKENHRLAYAPQNPLVIRIGDTFYEELLYENAIDLLKRINQILEQYNPDIILSSFGDQTIFPFLFSLAQKLKFPLLFDRDKNPTIRKITNKGTSFETYGQVIYRASSYPLFGRLHIDSNNSFIFKESFLYGIIELARLSRIPIQKMARSSTGTALTNIETAIAFQHDYLVPWQKSSIENKRTLYDLIRVDKGGLVSIPDMSLGVILENIFQLDFAQMYPSIMSHYNLSPETVNCLCCKDELEKWMIPGTNYYICGKRRGVVSEALENVLDRRKFYKQKLENENSDVYEARQNALKWMLVTSFGYLGYRNAKFGRLESHESVTAIGREVLLTAKEIIEDSNLLVMHMMTDSLFVSSDDGRIIEREKIQMHCRTISEATKIDLKIEGEYAWLVFPASKQDPEIGVVNRYFGKFKNGKLKVRGIFLRRKDIAEFIKSFQHELLKLFQECDTIVELKNKRNNYLTLFFQYEEMLKNKDVKWQELLLKRTITKDLDEYKVNSQSTQSIQQLKDLKISINPGEKIKYLVIRNKYGAKEYVSEETILHSKITPQIYIPYYRELLLKAFEEVAEHLYSEDFFKALRQNQLIFSFENLKS
ncbi:DNA polymerase domain-containing protein [Leptospira meyeri]|uniref:DNA polymerase domain-containing protein n=1 Tax=Leptospira meyeri TaxID=29508 RepID=UPI000C29E6E6|nr:DNA polymerase domain-containing protein [Leptospira meyeri]PJZ79259.1 DNA polymerase [Leptospira meyeri]PJZ95093.1 DNA polymerase [Leptospira meyeri]